MEQFENNRNCKEENNRNCKITGQNNRYAMKKVLKQIDNTKELKKKLDYELTFEEQFNIISEIQSNVICPTYGTYILKKIKTKISGYKHQDILKNIYQEKDFIELKTIIDKMVECELKCHYCKRQMFILYNISREKSQWTVDRICNDMGHNKENFYLACLECNLKRKRLDDEKFLFTKQLNIVRIP